MIDYELLLFDRIEIIKTTIQKYGEDKFYMSFSGGKDSTLLHKLLDLAIPNNNIPRVFINTGLEYNAIVEFVTALTKEDKRIVIVSPKIPVKKMLEEHGYPFKSKDFSRKVFIYQRNGKLLYGLQKWLQYTTARNSCPNCLRYMFTEENKIKISDKCCLIRKEKPLEDWSKENNKSIAMISILGDEHGRRNEYGKFNGGCFITRGKVSHFYPLKKVDMNFENWFFEKYNVQLCKLYYPPFNFKRTGCKGCPFDINIQKTLDTMEELMPIERQQAEAIWKPVYEEYRRLGYRLKRKEDEDD